MEDILDTEITFVVVVNFLSLKFFFVVSYFNISLAEVAKVITSRKKNNTISELLVHMFLSCLSYFYLFLMLRCADARLAPGHNDQLYFINIKSDSSSNFKVF